jgi:hypothetical protein
VMPPVSSLHGRDAVLVGYSQKWDDSRKESIWLSILTSQR